MCIYICIYIHYSLYLAHCIISGTFGWWGGRLCGGEVVYFDEPSMPDSERYRTFTSADYFPVQWKPLHWIVQSCTTESYAVVSPNCEVVFNWRIIPQDICKADSTNVIFTWYWSAINEFIKPIGSWRCKYIYIYIKMFMFFLIWYIVNSNILSLNYV